MPNLKSFNFNFKTISQIALWEITVELIWAGVGKWALDNNTVRDWGYLVVFCVALVSITAYLIFHDRQLRSTRSKDSTMKGVVGQIFVNQTVPLDGIDYIDCSFENCTFTWSGGPWAFHNPKHLGMQRLETKLKSAIDTVDLLKYLGFLGKDFAESWKHLPEEYFQSKP